MKIRKNEKGQAVAPETVKFKHEAFQAIDHCEIRWLAGAGIMINSRGTNIMIDPVLEGFDMPLLVDMPILPKEIPSLDGILITHIDNDHMSISTCLDVSPVCKSYHAPHYVAGEMVKEPEAPKQRPMRKGKGRRRPARNPRQAAPAQNAEAPVEKGGNTDVNA